MGFYGILKFNDQGYSQIISYDGGQTTYRIIRNPSKLTQLYYLTKKDNNNEIFVKLYPWDKLIYGLDK